MQTGLGKNMFSMSIMIHLSFHFCICIVTDDSNLQAKVTMRECFWMAFVGKLASHRKKKCYFCVFGMNINTSISEFLSHSPSHQRQSWVNKTLALLLHYCSSRLSVLPSCQGRERKRSRTVIFHLFLFIYLERSCW